MKNKGKFIKTIKVVDPDSKGIVIVEIYKHENGGMFGIDQSYIDQVLDEDSPTIPDMFSEGEHFLELTDLDF